MWKGIKKTSSNNPNHLFSTAITVNNVTVTSPTDIANAFNNCFAKIAIDIIKILWLPLVPKYRIILYSSNW